MERLITASAMAALALTGCGQEKAGPANPTGEDQFYALFFDEVMERGESWWGYPPPADYCVAVVPASMGPDFEQSRDPSQAVLESLGRMNPGKRFHPFGHCSGDFPFQAPSGEAAGILWVAPLETTNGVTLSGGWSAQRDMTEWDCMFAETSGTVEQRECSLRSET